MSATTMTRRFSVEEYYRMAEAGILDPMERVELIDGEILRIAAIGSRHAGVVKRLNRFMSRELGGRVQVQIQDPVRLGEFPEPEPDVADTTATFDQEVKVPFYAAAGIPEYWLVDLSIDRVEVHRETEQDGYRKVSTHLPGDALRPVSLRDLEVPVDVMVP